MNIHQGGVLSYATYSIDESSTYKHPFEMILTEGGRVRSLCKSRYSIYWGVKRRISPVMSSKQQRWNRWNTSQRLSSDGIDVILPSVCQAMQKQHFLGSHQRQHLPSLVFCCQTCHPLQQAEDEHAAMLVQAGHDARRRQCMSRTRGECVAALANFLPALRKRLFLAVDVTGPVRR